MWKYGDGTCGENSVNGANGDDGAIITKVTDH